MLRVLHIEYEYRYGSIIYICSKVKCSSRLVVAVDCMHAEPPCEADCVAHVLVRDERRQAVADVLAGESEP